VLRILTLFSVTLLPLTVITSLFGMNVRFPGFDTAEAFWVLVAVMIATVVCTVAFFRYKRWF